LELDETCIGRKMDYLWRPLTFWSAAGRRILPRLIMSPDSLLGARSLLSLGGARGGGGGAPPGAALAAFGARQSRGWRPRPILHHDLPQRAYYSLEVKLWLDLAKAPRARQKKRQKQQRAPRDV